MREFAVIDLGALDRIVGRIERAAQQMRLDHAGRAAAAIERIGADRGVADGEEIEHLRLAVLQVVPPDILQIAHGEDLAHRFGAPRIHPARRAGQRHADGVEILRLHHRHAHFGLDLRRRQRHREVPVVGDEDAELDVAEIGAAGRRRRRAAARSGRRAACSAACSRECRRARLPRAPPRLRRAAIRETTCCGPVASTMTSARISSSAPPRSTFRPSTTSLPFSRRVIRPRTPASVMKVTPGSRAA